MAKDKSSFLLYCDIIHTIKKLSNNDAGELFKHLLSYVNDENPTTENFIVEIAFEPIKQKLKRDLRTYKSIVEKRSLAGLASAEKRKQNQHMSTSVENAEQTSTNSTDSDNDNVIVNDNVKEKIIKASANKLAVTKKYDFIDSIINEFVLAHGDYVIVNRGKERAAASKLLEIYKKKYPAADSGSTIEALRHYFDMCIRIEDDWLRDNMSLPTIISKFNQINKILKNGKHTNNKGGTDAEFFTVIGQHLSRK